MGTDELLQESIIAERGAKDGGAKFKTSAS